MHVEAGKDRRPWLHSLHVAAPCRLLLQQSRAAATRRPSRVPSAVPRLLLQPLPPNSLASPRTLLMATHWSDSRARCPPHRCLMPCSQPHSKSSHPSRRPRSCATPTTVRTPRSHATVISVLLASCAPVPGPACQCELTLLSCVRCPLPTPPCRQVQRLRLCVVRRHRRGRQGAQGNAGQIRG